MPFRLYYRYDPKRLSTCPLTVHALLHIASSIKATGPVWTNWAFPTERYCGDILLSIKSRRFPYASINSYITDRAHLSHIKLLYGIEEELALEGPSQANHRKFQHENCKKIVHHTFSSNFIVYQIHTVSFCHRMYAQSFVTKFGTKSPEA